MALTGTGAARSSSSLTHSLSSVLALRLSLGLVALVGATAFFFGTSWDIQWHVLIGRDRTLIPPHIVMLTGVGISGIAALSAIIIETFWARRNPALASSGTTFADAFSGSLGAYIIGFAALNSAIAFPLDAYWHALYGIDVSILAPFHIMIISGMALVALGCAYMLVSAAHLAARLDAPIARRVATLGVMTAQAVMMSIFTFLLFELIGRRWTLDLGFLSLNFFIAFAALLGCWTFVTATRVLPWRWAATSVVGIYYLVALIDNFYVPPVTGTLMTTEHLALRQANPGVSIVTFEWPLLPLLAALAIDSVTQMARRRNWSLRRLILTEATIAIIGFLPVLLWSPASVARLFSILGPVGFVASLLLGWLGCWLGTWFGQRMGASMQQVEEV
ncbi:MAG: hypothetical protein M3Y39_05020 [Chloroflexota bacterium]|nr:hypothetical protein [Chloroflexota bacterium]